jgi:hypothetical protein
MMKMGWDERNRLFERLETNKPQRFLVLLRGHLCPDELGGGAAGRGAVGRGGSAQQAETPGQTRGVLRRAGRHVRAGLT